VNICTKIDYRANRVLSAGTLLCPEEDTPLWASDILAKNDRIGVVEKGELCILLRNRAKGFLYVICRAGVGYVDGDLMMDEFEGE